MNLELKLGFERPLPPTRIGHRKAARSGSFAEWRLSALGELEADSQQAAQFEQWFRLEAETSNWSSMAFNRDRRG